MRLLEITIDGQFFFTEWFRRGDHVPPYAILSHTWEQGQEVTYDDWINGRAMDKKGYDKIRFLKMQCQRDGLRYFWIDTCCLIKEDPDEHDYALSSMFRWYHNATRCYVLLSDVLHGKPEAESSENMGAIWVPAFEKSKWFTRGWTFQELIAPKSVEFFSRDWRRLGDKSSLEKYICKTTSIPPRALQGAPLYQFRVEERIFWAEHRQTRLPQDRAYSLMGILGVQVPGELYNKGENRAWDELIDKTEKLEACLCSICPTDPYDEMDRIEKMKGDLLLGSYNWIFGNTDFELWCDSPNGQLLWISVNTGKGKTMLLCGITKELGVSALATYRLAYFFFQAADSRMNTATAALRGLLYMVVQQQPQLRVHVTERYFDIRSSLVGDTYSFKSIMEAFTAVIQDPEFQLTYFIIDDLDQCTVDQQNLVDFVIHSTKSFRVSWIVSSCDSPTIQEQRESWFP
jgi:hypothetical protein